MQKMTSLKPHIVQAIYSWLLENDLTPHILVNAESWGVQVPRQHVKDGKIVLNLEPRAVREFDIGKDKIVFLARFNGVARRVSIPMRAILAIYALESGIGQQFDDTDFEELPFLNKGLTSNKVKSTNQQSTSKSSLESISGSKKSPLPVQLATVDETNSDDGSDGGDDDGSGGGKGKKTKAPWLRLVK